MTSVEVDVWVRDMETGEVHKILSKHIELKLGQKLEIFVDDQLKYEEEYDEEVEA